MWGLPGASGFDRRRGPRWKGISVPRSATVNQELRERSRERILAAALETFAA